MMTTLRTLNQDCIANPVKLYRMLGTGARAIALFLILSILLILMVMVMSTIPSPLFIKMAQNPNDLNTLVISPLFIKMAQNPNDLNTLVISPLFIKMAQNPNDLNTLVIFALLMISTISFILKGNSAYLKIMMVLLMLVFCILYADFFIGGTGGLMEISGYLAPLLACLLIALGFDLVALGFTIMRRESRSWFMATMFSWSYRGWFGIFP